MPLLSPSVGPASGLALAALHQSAIMQLDLMLPPAWLSEVDDIYREGNAAADKLQGGKALMAGE